MEVGYWAGGWCEHGIMEASRCDQCIEKWRAAGIDVQWHEGDEATFRKALAEVIGMTVTPPKIPSPATGAKVLKCKLCETEKHATSDQWWHLNNYFGVSGTFCNKCYDYVSHDSYGNPNHPVEYRATLDQLNKLNRVNKLCATSAGVSELGAEE